MIAFLTVCISTLDRLGLAFYGAIAALVTDPHVLRIGPHRLHLAQQLLGRTPRCVWGRHDADCGPIGRVAYGRGSEGEPVAEAIYLQKREVQQARQAGQ